MKSLGGKTREELIGYLSFGVIMFLIGNVLPYSWNMLFMFIGAGFIFAAVYDWLQSF